MGQLGQVRIAVVAVERLEHLGRTPMKSHASRGAELAIERVADEDVREAQATTAAGKIRDDARRHRLVEAVEQRVARALAQPLQRVEPELAAQHRGHREQALAVGREPAEAVPDHLAHALGQGRPPGRGPRLVETPFGGEQPDELADEERVALGLSVHGSRESVAGGLARDQLDDAGHLGQLKPSDPHEASDGLAPQLGHGCPQRIAVSRLDVAVGPDEHQARLA